MTGHNENFSRLDGSFELSVCKSYEREGENNKTYRQNITIFSITERKILAYRYFFSMSGEETHSARKRMLKITSGVFYCILFKNSAKKVI